MGFNLVRWVGDPQYRAIKRWKRDKGDETRRLDYPLGPDSVVVDVGAYVGEFAVAVAQRSGATVHAFEPVPAFAEQARAAAIQCKSVHVHAFGLSNRNETSSISIEGLASSRKRQADEMIKAEFRDAPEVLEGLGIRRIDLLKINIEGGEYELLPRLFEQGWAGRITDIQVQFHLIEKGDAEKYRRIAETMARTHRLTWRYPFIWENWHALGQ